MTEENDAFFDLVPGIGIPYEIKDKIVETGEWCVIGEKEVWVKSWSPKI